ncbi:MAG: Hsp20/alpha crystallin family protein [Candidatus Methylacidiphilales bacterium]|nr:Hsp20/alpha crystallin family protein [Candidatus Methylacidiphilales bacterium]
MRAITRWDPVRELDEFQNRLATLFGRSTVPATNDNPSEWLTRAEWAPLVDIVEDEKEYLIKAELPEVQKADVRVTLERGVLTLAGERKSEKEEKGKKFHRIERSYGSFVRSFSLPDDANPNGVTAEFKDGVLHVRVQKAEEAKPRQIDVKIN